MMKATGSILIAATLLAGCSSKDADLSDFIEKTKQEQPGGVESLPEVKPYESFFYTAQTMRSPFVPGGSGESSSPNLRPDNKRNREFLEQFPLDTMKMVGTLSMSGRRYGLVKARDGKVYRVQTGNYIGQNEGHITQIEDSKITLAEIVPDGLGGYMERGAALALNE
ncbi:MAG TPA: pilus assembly protein PilP [Steroidobacteraceae bacterium]|nr:pilus assembly protein PilP [Steroidobacteraceae bacterium]